MRGVRQTVLIAGLGLLVAGVASGQGDGTSLQAAVAGAKAAAATLVAAERLAETTTLLQVAGLASGLGLGLVGGAVGGLRYYRGKL